MAELNDIEYDEVVQIVTSSVTNEQMRIELIDHCCCVIEDLLSLGMTFNDSLSRALQIVAPQGFQEIETELQFILTPQISKNMKITLYFSGFIATLFILLGFLFKLLAWPGANQILLIGNLSLLFSMLSVIVTIIKFPTSFSGISLTRSLSGAIGGFVLGVGSLFKLMYWPGANIMILLGMITITFVFVPLFFWQLYKKEIAK